MPKQAVQIQLAPKVLSWTRTSAGWTIKEVAEKLKVDSSQIEGWEAGVDPVSLTQLEHLATYFKRPVAAFFLPQPPKSPPPPPDFRSLPERQGIFSKETWLALRRAHRLQTIAADLMQSMEQPTQANVGKASLDDDPDEVALQERTRLTRLEVSIAPQRAWEDPREALWGWRDLLERVNILTFQMQMPVEDCRGFSLAEQEPNVIVVSSKDSAPARTFSLFHEYGHLMLRRSGICMPREEVPPSQPDRVERWCDHFAGAFLMPKINLAEDDDCHDFLQEILGKERRLSVLARRYTVSRRAMLTRFVVLGWLSWERYRDEVSALGVSTIIRRGGRTDNARRAITEKGKTFASLVFQALEQNIVGYGEIADYLGIRLKHLERVRQLLAE